MNVGVFVRVSTVDQAKGESPQIHEQRARLHAESKGWKVVKVYDLAGVSGKSTRYHPQTELMLSDIQKGVIDGLIFSQLSRLARNTEELLYYANYFEQHNASLISLNESIDTSSSSGKFFYTILGALSTWERENNLDRIMASIETRRALGKFTGGQVSYGYKIDNGQVVINEDEADTRRLIYDLFLKYRRRATVARELNEMGKRTRSGKKWSDVTVDRLLKNTDAKGVRKSNFRKRPTDNDPSHLKPKDEWRYDPCPALISEEKWNQVNAILQEQENSLQAKPQNQRTNLFTGFIYCDKGHKMLIHSRTKKYSCPTCKVRIQMDFVEEQFKKQIKDWLKDNVEKELYLKNVREQINQIEVEIDASVKKVEEVKKKIDKLVELNLSGEIPTKGFREYYDPLELQKEQLEKTIELETHNLSQAKTTLASMNDSFKISEDTLDIWDTLERPEKRLIVELVTKKVTYTGVDLIFLLKGIAPIPSPKEMGSNGQHSGGCAWQ